MTLPAETVAPDELVNAVRVVAAGDALLAPSVTRRLIEEFARRSQDAAASSPSAADGEGTRVLKLVARGLSNAEIAAKLYVSEATVKTHVGHLLEKLELRDRVQAVVFAYETGERWAGSSSPPSSMRQLLSGAPMAEVRTWVLAGEFDLPLAALAKANAETARAKLLAIAGLPEGEHAGSIRATAATALAWAVRDSIRASTDPAKTPQLDIDRLLTESDLRRAHREFLPICTLQLETDPVRWRAACATALARSAVSTQGVKDALKGVVAKAGQTKLPERLSGVEVPAGDVAQYGWLLGAGK